MKKPALEKTHTLSRTLYSQLASSFKRALRIIGAESESTSNSQVYMKGLSETFFAYDGLQRMNAHLLEVERQKAEALQCIRRHSKCI
jgi:hypothetical protein